MGDDIRPYSVRKALTAGREFSLEQDFWPAYKAELQVMHREMYFKHTLSVNQAWSIYSDVNSTPIRLHLTRFSFPCAWPPKHKVRKTEICDYVQFFYFHAATSTEDTFGFSHPDKTGGRIRYSLRVNRILKQLVLPYKFEVGELRELSCKSLDEPILSFEFHADKELADLVLGATSAFYDPREERKKEALRLIVDALDRLKCEFAETTKESTEKCIQQIAALDSLIAPYRKLFDTLGQIANDATDLRHPENTDRELVDCHTIEYLFYSYFSLVRLILQRQEESRTG